MLWSLLVANLTLAMVVLAMSAWRARVSPPDMDRPDGTFETSVDAVHANAPDVAVLALLRLSSCPDAAVPVLPTALRLADAPTAVVAYAASVLVERVLSQRPDLLSISWPASAPLARQGIVASLPLSATTDAAMEKRRLVVREACADTDSRVRRQAARRLNWLGTDGVDVAAAMTDDGDDETRRLACAYLATAGNERSLYMLVDRLAASTPAGAGLLLETLSTLGARFPGRLDEMITASADTSVRVAAIRALGVGGHESSGVVLGARLRDPAAEVRRAAALALADLAVVVAPGRRPALAHDLVRQFRVETSASVTLALLDAIEICRPLDGIAAIQARVDGLYPAIRARASEVLAELGRTIRGGTGDPTAEAAQA